MKTMNTIEVTINNKKFTLCGYESGTYLQTVAAYMNEKYDELKAMDSYHKLEQDMRSALLGLNIADDYFKAKAQIEKLETEAENKNKELFEIKHELITTQGKLDEIQKELEELKAASIEEQKKIVKLETELAAKSGNGKRK